MMDLQTETAEEKKELASETKTQAEPKTKAKTKANDKVTKTEGSMDKKNKPVTTEDESSKVSRKQRKIQRLTEQGLDPSEALVKVKKSQKSSSQDVQQKTQAQLMKTYATGDKKLNSHVFGNLYLKQVDFANPEIKRMIRGPIRPDGKKQVFDFQMEKLRIMLLFYDQADFEAVKFYKLNADQILAFLQTPSFVGP